jgi:hypothetical protein
VRVKLHGEKGIYYGKSRYFYMLFLETKMENNVLEVEGSDSGHVWKLVGAINSQRSELLGMYKEILCEKLPYSYELVVVRFSYCG